MYSHFWSNASHAFPNITHLILASGTLSFLEFLRSQADQSVPTDVPWIPWPDLHTLTLIDPDHHYTAINEMLYRSLKARNELGYPLHQSRYRLALAARAGNDYKVCSRLRIRSCTVLLSVVTCRLNIYIQLGNVGFTT